MKLILASGSPRRKELLSLITSNFEVQVSGADETLKEGLTPQEQVERLAYKKAKEVFEKTTGDRIVIGSDTIVTKNMKRYGKPRDKADAKEMIKELLEGDRVHSIMTGLSILIEENGEIKEYKTHDEIKVYLKEMTDAEIDKWIDSGNAMDKAGAYGIQNEFCVFVEKIEGNYNSAVGLPIQKVYDVIKNYIDKINIEELGKKMKVLVISDIHGSGYYAERIKEINEREQPDKIILLGDIYYHGPRNDLSQEYNPMKVAEILNGLKDKLLVVRGNCDAEVDEMISEFKFNDHILMEINGKKCYFTHGHKYNIEKIPYDDFDIMMYGHIHQGFIQEKEGFVFANPGSISLPKCNTAHSYIIFDNNMIILKDVDGNVLQEFKV